MRELEIIRLLLEKEQTGIEELLRHYGPLMRYIIAPILPDLQDREECLSEVTMRVWENIEQYDAQRGSWTAWLTALTRNAALNRARRERRTEKAEELTEATPSGEPTPEERMLQLAEARGTADQRAQELGQLYDICISAMGITCKSDNCACVLR